MGVNRILKYKKLFVVRVIVPVPGRKSEFKAPFSGKKVIKKNLYGLQVLSIGLKVSYICLKVLYIEENI
ncbi:hypothetical protein ACSAZL_06650 [Methanosarcina sp. T3]|uniref:hypothetical protein n=1 Tax=Methanosarcina sp. T3 TaxID=3439062 RepID=UPI003F858DCF